MPGERETGALPPGLVPGLEGVASVRVTEERTAAAAASGALPVFGTPFLLALMEEAAFNATAPHLGPGQSTVGTAVELRHLAPTPTGLTVTARARLVRVEGRRLLFEVEAEDGFERVGEARHERYVVDVPRFLERAARKAGGPA
ncbi:MAG: thioesterase family protein [Firmicutes bacterium]|nr:thioesterase family protein [Bacillota bacterium]